MDLQYPDKKYPAGQEMAYPGGYQKRITSAEMREKDKLQEFEIQCLRKAAECHRQVRKFAQSYIRPGMKLIDICERLEEMNRYLVQENGLKAGIAFPTGCSLDHIAAHFSPNPGDETVLTYDNVMKLDFGTQVDGWIIDSAFTIAFNPMFDNLLKAAQDATETGLKGVNSRHIIYVNLINFVCP